MTAGALQAGNRRGRLSFLSRRLSVEAFPRADFPIGRNRDFARSRGKIGED